MKMKFLILLFLSFAIISCQDSLSSGYDDSDLISEVVDEDIAYGSNYISSNKRYIVVTQTTESSSDDSAIINKLIELVNNSSGRIRVSAYKFQNNSFFNSLATAKQNGRNVRVVFDRDEYSRRNESGFSTFISNMGHNPSKMKKGSSSKSVVFNQIGSVNNHNKYVLFEEVKFPGESGYRTNVIAQTSCNFKNTGRSNDLILIDDDIIYQKYYNYWLAEKKGSKSSYDKDYYGQYNSNKVYFFPKKSGDTILEILDNIEGTGGTLKIIQSQFEDFRGIEIANKIVEVASTYDIKVQIIATKYKNGSGSSSGYLSSQVESILTGKKNIELNVFARNASSNHSKVMILNVKNYNGKARKFVWTGSHNFNHNSLRRNDESLLRIEDSDVFNAYNSYFNKLRDTGVFE